MHSLVKRPSTMYKNEQKPYHNEQTLHTYCYSLIFFVIFYPKDCSQVRGRGSGL